MAQILQQIDDLRLNGNVERRYRLIGQHELRTQGNRSRDADTLPLSAGKFVRITIVSGRVQTNELQQFPDSSLFSLAFKAP